jgi:hypothetical protein
MATYKHIRSATANKRPTTSIADGQLAINTNTASPGLFFKDSAGTGIVKVGPVHVGTTAPNSTPAAGGSSGNYLGEQWLDTSVSPAQMKVWNGSAWVGVVADELPVSKLQDGTARQLIQTDAAGTGVEWTSNIDVPGTLDVTSTATFDSIARHPLGTEGAPTITFTGDTNTGIYSPGADQVAISTNGTGRLFVASDGKVGVGTETPGRIFQIDSGAVNNSYARFTNDNSTNSGVEIGLFDNGSSAGQLILSNTMSDGVILFNTNSTERLRITSDGKLGLGTSDPGSFGFFAVRGSAALGGSYGNVSAHFSDAATTSLFIKHAAGELGYFTDGAVAQTFYTSSTERVRIDSSGRVGIGTTPQEVLDVNGRGRFQGSTSSAASGAGLELAYVSGTTTGQLLTYNRSTSSYLGTNIIGNPLTFSIGVSEKARIDTSGRLLVGTTSALGSERLNVDGRYITQTATKLLGVNGGGNNTLALTLPSVKYIAGHLYVSASPEAANKGTVSIYKVFIQTISGQPGISTLTLEQTVDSSFSAGITVSLSNRVITVTNGELGYNNECRMVFHGMATN